MKPIRVPPSRVHAVLSRWMLAEGFDLVLDLEKSRGVRLFDSRRRRRFLDFFSFYASSPLGLNHPGLRTRDFEKRLLRAARHKPSLCDCYTTEMAEFVETFGRIALPAPFRHLFLVEGGTLGVENALKAAIDWKVRRNLAAGRGERGTQILHFREAFHGRSGYALSLTNTADWRKTGYFPKFDWPRVENPKVTFPLTRERLSQAIRSEARAVRQIRAAFRNRPHAIAAIVIEPIQSEGGDHHFRPEFFRTLRDLADAHDALLIADEVQTGIGITGKMWCWQHFGAVPDLFAFGKKTQVCGFAAGPRIDEVKENVFRVKSRLGSTWGGSLVDMVRSTRFLEIIRDDRLVENAARVGRHLAARIASLCAEFPETAGNPRGRGLLAAFDLPSTAARDAVKAEAYRRGLLILPCGERSLRFRPPLTIRAAEIDEGIGILYETIRAVERRGASATRNG